MKTTWVVISGPYQLLDLPNQNYLIVIMLTEADQLKIWYPTKYWVTPTLCSMATGHLKWKYLELKFFYSQDGNILASKIRF